MSEFLRLARAIRCDATDPAQTFRHRMGIDLAIALLILIISLLGLISWKRLPGELLIASFWP